MKIYIAASFHHEGDTILGVKATIEEARECLKRALIENEWLTALGIYEYELGEENHQFNKHFIEDYPHEPKSQ